MKNKNSHNYFDHLSSVTTFVIPSRLVFHETPEGGRECTPKPLTLDQKRFIVLQSRLQDLLNPNSTFMRANQKINITKGNKELTIHPNKGRKGITIELKDNSKNTSEKYVFDENMQLKSGEVRKLLAVLRHFGKNLEEFNEEYEMRNKDQLKKYHSQLGPLADPYSRPWKPVVFKKNGETLSLRYNRKYTRITWQKGQKKEVYMLHLTKVLPPPGEKGHIYKISSNSSALDLFPHLDTFKAELTKKAGELRGRNITQKPLWK